MKIDAHVHFWELGETHNIWSAKKIGGLQHNFTPEMLAPLCAAAGIDGVVVVQAATDRRETEYMVRLARETDLIKGVIGWLDLEAPADKLQAEMVSIGEMPKLCGIRAHPPKEFDPSWFTDTRIHASYRAVGAKGIPVDFLANCTQLEPVCDLLAAVPEMTPILNHGGRPFVMTGELERFKMAVVNAARAARAEGFADTEDQIVVTAGVPFNQPGTTNILRVAPCEERLIFSTDPG